MPARVGEHLGLAHFLEHMLFLGTEDYPNVGEYEEWFSVINASSIIEQEKAPLQGENCVIMVD